MNRYSRLLLDRDGSLIVSDTCNSLLRRVMMAGVVSTVAGRQGAYCSWLPNPARSIVDGNGNTALFDAVYGLALDSNGNYLVGGQQSIRRVTPAGQVSTALKYGQSDTGAPFSDIGAVYDLLADPCGDLYFIGGGRPRAILKFHAGSVAYFAGGQSVNAPFIIPRGLKRDAAGNFYVSDYTAVRKITPAGAITTLAGTFNDNNGKRGNLDGLGAAASFSNLGALAMGPDGNLAVTDNSYGVLRKVTLDGQVTTLAATPLTLTYADGQAGAARLNPGTQPAVDALGNVYISSAFLASSLAFDRSGNLYISDAGLLAVYQLNPSGLLSLFAGTPGKAGDSLGGPRSATFGYYGDDWMSADDAGNLYLSGQGALRKISAAGVVSVPNLLWGNPGLMGLAYSKGVLYGTTPNAVLQVAAP
ncbi:hypothetical protein [Janthinobacterium agaricidamnosum]|uniref:NHL repeat family protein n=1 Tax=Janthinobacterium agaricidamnosum NBRC 102515 = DSM 9628 TaxID=1349767 RepID=W0V8Y6_9BURK|nr:hypothetical protein [Janthinobacterium agaricidamnosum]CDG83737.1 NHL repeat family protein [Janthinobacterium agaricidamnosum NBRC 102515 = DSM 9628]